jgi:hypothetical protein
MLVRMSRTPKRFIRPIVISVREMWTYRWGDEAADAPALQSDSPVIYEARVTLDEVAIPRADGESLHTPHTETLPPAELPDASSDTLDDPTAGST